MQRAGTHFEELLIQTPYPVELAQPHLKLNVTGKQLGLRAHANTCAKNLTCSRQVESAHFKVGIGKPELITVSGVGILPAATYLCEGKSPMRYKLDSSLVNVPCSLIVLRVNLLERSVLQPHCAVLAMSGADPQTSSQYCQISNALCDTLGGLTMYRLQNRFSSAGGTLATARS